MPPPRAGGRSGRANAGRHSWGSGRPGRPRRRTSPGALQRPRASQPERWGRGAGVGSGLRGAGAGMRGQAGRSSPRARRPAPAPGPAPPQSPRQVHGCRPPPGSPCAVTNTPRAAAAASEGSGDLSGGLGSGREPTAAPITPGVPTEPSPRPAPSRTRKSRGPAPAPGHPGTSQGGERRDRAVGRSGCPGGEQGR